MGRAPRPAVPRRRLRRVGRRAARRLGGAQLEAGRPGHGPLQLRRRPGPVGARRLDARRRTSGSGASRRTSAASPTSRVVKANQLMPKPTHLTWEEAAVNALCNSTSYRMLVGAHGARHEAGRHRAHLGRDRRHRRLRGAVRAQRRRHARRRRVVAGQGRAAARDGLRGGHRPQGRRLPVLDGRAHAGRGRVAPPRQGHPRARRRGPRHRVRAPGSPDDGCVGVRREARRHRRHVRGDVRLHDRVRQPPLLDEAEAIKSSATSPTTARRGTRTGSSPRARSSRCCRRCIRSTDVGEAAYRSTRTSTRARSACCASRPAKGSASTTPSCATKVGEDSITLFRRHA